MSPFSTSEKLRIKFRKSINKNEASNAELDPRVPDGVQALSEPGESFIVKVVRSNHGIYWFTDGRVLLENDGAVDMIAEYRRIRKAHWMFKDLDERLRSALNGGDEGRAASIKRDYFDRIELEIDHEVVVLEGLGQAYWPTLHFFWWIIRTPSAKTS